MANYSLTALRGWIPVSLTKVSSRPVVG